jgi:hypothetical protein
VVLKFGRFYVNDKSLRTFQTGKKHKGSKWPGKIGIYDFFLTGWLEITFI